MSPSTRFNPAAVEADNKENHFNNLAAKETLIARSTRWHTFIDVKNVEISPTIHIIICNIWWHNTNTCENAAKLPQWWKIAP